VEDLEKDLADLAQRENVFEIIRSDLTRRPFVDVDGKTSTPEYLKHSFQEVFGCEALCMETGRGFHLVAAPSEDTWITLKEHRSKLFLLAKTVPDVDVACVHSLRLAGTFKNKNGQVSYKQLPSDWRLRDTLCQPPTAGRTADVQYTITRDDHTVEVGAAALQRMSTLITGQPDVFEEGPCQGGRMTLMRKRPAHCNVCDCTHDSENAIVYLNRGSWKTLLYCPRARSHIDADRPAYIAEVFDWNGLEDGAPDKRKSLAERLEDPGPLETRSFANTEDIGCDDVRRIRSGSYLDASPCGAGKSLAFWETVPQDQTIVVVSYRKAFTVDVCAKYGLTSYQNIPGLIDLERHKRVAIQVDSLHKLLGVPQVLLLDEIHGAARHMLDSNMTFSQSRSLPVLCDLPARVIARGGRVVILDAAANDLTHAWAERVCGVQLPAIASSPVMEHTKEVVVYKDHRELELVMCQAFQALAAARERGGTDKHKIAVFAHLKGDPASVRFSGKMSCVRVNSLATRFGLHTRVVTGDTPDKERQAIFSNLTGAAEDVDVFIHNTALEAGVSMEDTQFKVVFSFSSQLGHAESEFQGLSRWRYSKHIKLAFATNQYASPGPTSIQALRLQVEDSSHWTGIGIEELDNSSGLLWTMVRLEKNRCAAFYPGRLASLFRLNGHTVTVHDTDIQAKTAVPKNESLPLNLTTCRYDEIAECNLSALLSGPEDQIEVWLNSPSSSAARARMFLEKHYQVWELDREFVKLYGSNTWIERRYNYLRVQGLACPPRDNFVNTTSYSERLMRINDTLSSVGLGTMQDPTPAGAAALNTFQTEEFSRLWGASARLFPTQRTKKAPASRNAFIKYMNSILTQFNGGALMPSNNKHQDRGTYTFVNHEWPGPDPPKRVPVVITINDR